MDPVMEDLAAQVQRNCRISDSRSWGFHSICGLLLRLREQYKWERGLEPWSKAETADVLPWIEEREGEWETLHEAEPEPLVIGGDEFDPFDVEGVNARISPLGYFYGAGHGMAMKDLFILGRVVDRRCVDGSNVVVLGDELVRDLSPIPAMSRDGIIVARREAMKWFLWLHLEDQAAKGDEGLAARALRGDGVELSKLAADPESHRGYLEKLVEIETEAAVHHELGEIAEERRLDGKWHRTFSLSCGTKAELLARGLKDMLADTGEGGRLQFIVGQKNIVSLGLLAAFSDGLRKKLFPGLGDLFSGVLEDGDWGKVDDGRRAAHKGMRRFIDPLLGLFEQGLSREEIGERTDALEEEMLR